MRFGIFNDIILIYSTKCSQVINSNMAVVLSFSKSCSYCGNEGVIQEELNDVFC